MEGFSPRYPRSRVMRRALVHGFGVFVLLDFYTIQNLFKQILKKVLTNLFKQGIL